MTLVFDSAPRAASGVETRMFRPARCRTRLVCSTSSTSPVLRAMDQPREAGTHPGGVDRRLDKRAVGEEVWWRFR